LCDRIIVSGKLPEIWETGLQPVSVQVRIVDGGRECIVRFDVDKESPHSVYFFFDRAGKYSGSNFKG